MKYKYLALKSCLRESQSQSPHNKEFKRLKNKKLIIFRKFFFEFMYFVVFYNVKKCFVYYIYWSFSSKKQNKKRRNCVSIHKKSYFWKIFICSPFFRVLKKYIYIFSDPINLKNSFSQELSITRLVRVSSLVTFSMHIHSESIWIKKRFESLSGWLESCGSLI